MSRPEFVTSRDGTRIAYRRVGGGPPVVVIHGGLGSRRSWLAVADRLADRFEFVLIDRRGRGDSDDGAPPHSLAREVDDARAVLEAVGPAVALIGHSFGGAVALELARAGTRGDVDRLVLYEPGVGVAGLVPSPEIARLHELVDQGQSEQVLDLAIRRLDAAGLVHADGAASRPSPQRDALAKIAWTIAREISAVDAVGNDLSRYETIELPTLLLVGSSSPDRQQRNCQALTRVLPHVRIVRLHGQGHVAHNGDPARAAATVGEFLTDRDVTVSAATPRARPARRA